jgi:hypothetical protein
MLGKIKQFFSRFFRKEKEIGRSPRAEKRRIWRKTWEKIRDIDKRV